MATTTNYGWTTPDDTALVKDGAAAIRTLGTSIDTTTKNLNPSTTLGDIEYRSSTANTNTRLGIGSSGQGLQVVAGVPSWAASSTSTLTTTGDLLYASAANTLARRAIGTSGQVLTVSGGVPTWATASSGGMTLLSTTTLSGTATTISSISGSYTNLQIIVKGVNQSANGGLILNPNGASNLTTWWLMDGAAGSGGAGTATPTYLPLTGNQSDLLASQTDNAFCCIIYDYASAASVKNFAVQSRFRKNATPTYAPVGGGGGIATSSAISSIQITTTGGSATHSAGTVEIYGVK